jgi:hypothetical protein
MICRLRSLGMIRTSRSWRRNFWLFRKLPTGSGTNGLHTENCRQPAGTDNTSTVGRRHLLYRLFFD